MIERRSVEPLRRTLRRMWNQDALDCMLSQLKGIGKVGIKGLDAIVARNELQILKTASQKLWPKLFVALVAAVDAVLLGTMARRYIFIV